MVGVRVEMPSNQPIVLLREVTGERYLPIWIGAVEATAIAFAQQGVAAAAGNPGAPLPRAGAGRTSGGRNSHPTVKPTDLMRYLCRLVTPHGGVVLDPFFGSGTTGQVATECGCNCIGIELNAEYVKLAKRRNQQRSLLA